MTHDENLVVSVVLHQLEVVPSFPVILFLEDIDVFEVLLGKLDNLCSVLHMEGGVSHHDVIKNLNLLELIVQILGPLDIADTIAVKTELEILLQPSEGLWLPFHVDVKPVITLVEIWHFNVSITILTGDLGIDQSATHKAVGGVFLDQIEDAVGILISSSSWEKSRSKLGYGKSVESSSTDLNSRQVVLRVLISVTELTESSVAALKHNVTVFSVVKALVDGPESENLPEIIEVHPENTIITSSIKANLTSELFGPKWGGVRPVTVPFTTTPWVSQLDKTNCISVDI